eukprot:3185499-Prymnesium_polylepis.1
MAEKLGVQLPRYDVLQSGDDWEVRRYQRLAIVECEYEKRPEGAARMPTGAGCRRRRPAS